MSGRPPWTVRWAAPFLCPLIFSIVDAAREIGLKSISFQAADVTTTAFNHPHGWEPGRAAGVAVPRAELAELTETIEKLIRTRADEILEIIKNS